MRVAMFGTLVACLGLAACSAPPAPADSVAPGAAPVAAAPAAPVATATESAPPVASTAPPATAAPVAVTASPSGAHPTRPASATSRPAVAAAGPMSAPASPTAAAPAPTAAPMASPAAPAAPPAPVYREVTLPVGTRVSVELRTTHASNTSQVEDRVQGVLKRALSMDGDEVVPAGAALTGSVIEATPAGRVKGKARLALRFTSLAIDDGTERIATEAIAREADSTKKEDAAKIGIGAGAGAIVGAIVGGKKGAVVGGTVGAGAGTGVVLATRGDEVSLASGALVTTALTQPLTVRIRVR